MFKKISLAVAMVLCGGAASLWAADPIMWYPGAFEVDGTNIKTTTVIADPAVDGITRFSIAFKDEKSNQGYAQFPLKSDADAPAIEIAVKAEQNAVAEVWVQDGAKWYFLEKINITSGDWKTYPIEIKEITAKQVSWVRLIFPNKVNPMKNTMWFKNPQFVN